MATVQYSMWVTQQSRDLTSIYWFILSCCKISQSTSSVQCYKDWRRTEGSVRARVWWLLVRWFYSREDKTIDFIISHFHWSELGSIWIKGLMLNWTQWEDLTLDTGCRSVEDHDLTLTCQSKVTCCRWRWRLSLSLHLSASISTEPSHQLLTFTAQWRLLSVQMMFTFNTWRRPAAKWPPLTERLSPSESLATLMNMTHDSWLIDIFVYPVMKRWVEIEDWLQWMRRLKRYYSVGGSLASLKKKYQSTS